MSAIVAARARPAARRWWHVPGGIASAAPTVATFTADKAAAGQASCDAWIEIYTKDPNSGLPVTWRFATHSLADDDTYYGGYKDGRIVSMQPPQRTLTYFLGTWISNTWSVTVTDLDNSIRDLLTNPLTQPVVGATVVCRIIGEADRLALNIPVTAFRGTITRVTTTSPWELTIYCQDPFTDQLSRGTPYRRVIDIFSPATYAVSTTVQLQAAPLIFGALAETGGACATIPLGLWPGSSTGYAFLVARHAVSAITNVYVDGSVVPTGEYGTTWFLPNQPGYSAFSSTPYIDVAAPDGSTIRCTIVFVIGPDAGGTITVDVEGLETNGDTTGALVTSIYDQILYYLGNFAGIAPEYQNGPYAFSTTVSPTFSDGAPLFDLTRWAATKARAIALLGDDAGAWSLQSQTALQNVLAQLSLSAGVDFGFTREGALQMALVDWTLGGMGVPTWSVSERDDLYERTFGTDDDRTTPVTQQNEMVYGLRPDLSGKNLGDLTVGIYQHTDSISQYGVLAGTSTTGALTVTEFPMRRSQAPVATIVQRAIAMTAYPYRLATIVMGLQGATVEPGDTIALTTREGLSRAGWTNRVFQVRSVQVDPISYTTTMLALDLRIDAPLVQQVNGFALASATLGLTLDFLPTVGNLLTVMAAVQSGSSVKVSGVSGGGVGTWLPGKQAVTGGGNDIDLWYGLVTGTPTTAVTVALTAPEDVEATAAEWTGMAAVVFPTTGTAAGTGGSVSSGTCPSALAGQLVLAAAYQDHASTVSAGPTNDFIPLSRTSNGWLLPAYKVVPYSQSPATGWTSSTSAYVGVIAAFQRAT